MLDFLRDSSLIAPMPGKTVFASLMFPGEPTECVNSLKFLSAVMRFLDVSMLLPRRPMGVSLIGERNDFLTLCRGDWIV